MITYFKNGCVNVQDNWMPWIAICYILMWPINTNLDQRSINIANEQLKRFPAQKELLKIELKVGKIVENYQVGLNFNIQTWYVLLKPKIDSIHEFRVKYDIDRDMSINDASKRFVESNHLSTKLPMLTDELLRIQDDPLIQELFQYRKDILYVNNYWHNVLKLGKRLDMDYYNLGGHWETYSTYTGRMRCSKFPLMSMPRKMRTCLKPPSGYRYISIDFSNIELRIAAALTHCKLAQKRFENGQDIHQITGSKLVGSLCCDNELIRKVGKKITFAILYGGSNRAIQEVYDELLNVKVSFSDAQEIISGFYMEYPELKKLRDINKRKVISTPIGDIPVLIELTDTQLINFPIQFMGSILLKKSLISVSNISKPILSVHDEIIFCINTNQDIGVFESQIEKALIQSFNEIMPNLCVTKAFKFTNYDNEEK